MEGSLVGRAVAEEAERHPVDAAHLGAERAAGRNRQAGADDACLSKTPDAEVGQVHRAAFALADPGPLAEELRHQRPDVGALGDRMPMGSMGSRDVVILAKGHAGAHSRTLLAYRKMNSARYLSRPGELAHVFLETSRPDHPAVHFERSRSVHQMILPYRPPGWPAVTFRAGPSSAARSPRETRSRAQGTEALR